MSGDTYVPSHDVATNSAGTTVAVWVRLGQNDASIRTAHRVAGGSWSTPVTLDPAADSYGSPSVAVDSAGNAVAVWSKGNGTDVRIRTARRSAAGSWSTPTALTPAGTDSQYPQVAVDGDGDASAVWALRHAWYSDLQIAYRPKGGAWTKPTTLAEAENPYLPKIAADAAGNGVMAWESASRVRTSYRKAGGSWSQPVTVTTGQQSWVPSVGIDGTGTAFATWAKHDGSNWRIQAAHKTRLGSWNRPVTLSPAGKDAENPDIGVSSNGDAVAAWYAGAGGEARTEAARRPAGGSWSSSVAVSPAQLHGMQTGEGPRVQVDSRGDAVVAWHSYDEAQTGWHVGAARQPRSGAWQGHAVVSGDEQTRAPELAADASGNVVASWAVGQGGLRTATLDAGGPRSAVIAPTARRQTSTTFDVGWSAADAWSGVANHDVRYREAPRNAGFGVFTSLWSGTTATSGVFTTSPGRTVCFSARARDTLDNVGSWSAERCTATPIDDRTFVASSSWTRGSNTAYYQGTYTLSKTSGATLTRTGLQTKHIALLATKCASCGSVRVDNPAQAAHLGEDFQQPADRHAQAPGRLAQR